MMSESELQLKILLAVDDSRSAAAAVDLITHISWPPDTSAQVLTWTPGPLPLTGRRPAGPDAVDDEVEILHWRNWSVARILGTQTAVHLKTHALQVATEVCEGHPIEDLLERAADWPADLIVIGATSFNAVSEFRLGSTAQALLHKAPCSVLIARPARHVRPLNTVLVADSSAQAQAAVELLCALSLPNWARLTVVCLAEEKNGTAEPALFKHHPLVVEEPLGATKMIEQFEAADVRIGRVLHAGHSAADLAAMVRSEEASLVVFGLQEQAGPGSAAESKADGLLEKVVKYAPCSALIVQGNEE